MKHDSQNEKAAVDWGKVFRTHMPDKGCVLRMFKELLQINNKMTDISIKIEQLVWTDPSWKKVYKELTST